MSLQRCGVCRRLTLANFCSMCQRGMSGNLDAALLDVLAAEERQLDYQEYVAHGSLAGGRQPAWPAIAPLGWSPSPAGDGMTTDTAALQAGAAMILRAPLAEKCGPAPPGLDPVRMAAVRCDERALGPVEDWSRGVRLPPHIAQEAQSRAPRFDFWSWLRDKLRLQAQRGGPPPR